MVYQSKVTSEESAACISLSTSFLHIGTFGLSFDVQFGKLFFVFVFLVNQLTELRELVVIDLHKPFANSSLIFSITFILSLHILRNFEWFIPTEVLARHWKLPWACILVKFPFILRIIWELSSILNDLVIVLDWLHVERLVELVFNHLHHFIHKKLLELFNHAPLSKVCLFLSL